MTVLVPKTMQKQVGCGAGSSVSNNFCRFNFIVLICVASVMAYVSDVQDTK